MEIKDRILNKTEEMFLKYGFKRVRTDEIASEIGISKRTLYEHFPSKSILISEMLKRRFEDFQVKMDNKIDELENSTSDTYLKMIKEMGEIVAGYFTFFSPEMLEDIEKNLPNFRNECRNYEKEKIETIKVLHDYGIKHNKIRKEINFDVFYQIMKFSMNNMLRPEIMKQLSLTANEIIEQIHSILMIGLLTNEATEEIIKI